MNLIQELVNQGESSLEKNKRKKKAIADFGFFCQYYLSDYFFSEAAEYQKILYSVANTQALNQQTVNLLKPFVNAKYHTLLQPDERLSGAMFIEPREHGKTVRWSFAYVLWCVLTNRKKYILLIGASDTAAKENLGNIKTELEENERILEDFDLLEGAVWKDSRIELANNTCIQAKGSGMSMRGTRFRQYRPDMIVLDDILKDEAADSASQRNKIHRWLKRVVFNLGKTSFMIWVNTIFHGDDPVSRLCEELSEGTLKRWIAVRLSCYKPDGSPLWPEYWSKEDLEEKKSSIGFAHFSTEYGNEPLSDEERIIHKDWIETHQYESFELPQVKELQYFCGVDPATGKHDRTAQVPLAVHSKTGIIYVLPTWAKTCSETETVNQLVLFHSLYRFSLIGWEDVIFSGIYGNYVQRLAAERGVYLPIKKLSVHMSKEARVRSISSLIENGIIRFPVKGAKNIIAELTEFPAGAYDDLCDALVHAVNTISVDNKITVISNAKKKIETTVDRIIRKTRGLS